jgi:hypothetical protein
MITYIIAASYQDYASYCKDNKIDPNDQIFVRDVKNLIPATAENSKFVFTKMASNHPQYRKLVERIERIISERRRGYDVHEEILAVDS